MFRVFCLKVINLAKIRTEAITAVKTNFPMQRPCLVSVCACKYVLSKVVYAHKLKG